MNKNPEIYEWDYDGACAPGNYGMNGTTFSLGIFQWIPKKSKGLKRSKVVYRIKGYSNNPDKTFDKAKKVIKYLNKEFDLEFKHNTTFIKTTIKEILDDKHETTT